MQSELAVAAVILMIVRTVMTGMLIYAESVVLLLMDAISVELEDQSVLIATEAWMTTESV